MFCKLNGIADRLTDDIGPFVGNLTFYQFNMIISGVCTAIVLILIFGLMGRHAMHMSNPNEQLK